MDELVKRLHRYTENCVAYKLDADFASAVQEAADAIEELLQKTQQLPRWIPVTERLPYPGDKVIVAIRDESGDTRFDFTNTGWWSGYGYKFVVEDEFCSWVTHYMPLPEPPKEE